MPKPRASSADLSARASLVATAATTRQRRGQVRPHTMVSAEGLISLVIPTYNVAKYLPQFLVALEQQTLHLSNLDIIFVDDGSTDDSAEIVKQWINNAAPSARIISKANGGLCSARNAGLECVVNPWVNFCDPDDLFPPDYFEVIATFLASEAAHEVHLIATNIQILDDTTGEIRDEHPLSFRFMQGDQLVNLAKQPQYIHLQAASAFYRTRLIVEQGLRFDHLVQPNFEDGYFTTLYLSAQEGPRVALLSSARYFYRHRDDGSSLVQSSWGSSAKYTDVTRYGYLRLLERVHARLEHVPMWVQNLVLYDLSWYYKQDERIHSAVGSIAPDITEEFHSIVRQILAYIDVETIEDYRLTPLSPVVRNALIIGGKGSSLRPSVANIARLDHDKRIAQIRYFFGGELPVEEFFVGGCPIAPIHSKVRSVTLLGKQMASERIVWLPATSTLSMALDGRRMMLNFGSQPQTLYSAAPNALWRRLAGRPAPVESVFTRDVSDEPDVSIVGRADANTWLRPTSLIRHLKRRLKLRTRVRRTLARVTRSQADGPAGVDRSLTGRTFDWLTCRAATSTATRRRYGHAWVFTDRDDMAQDNAEHLYRFVRHSCPEANAWFVINRDSHDWDRLKTDGFRLVSYGTWRHVLLMLNCDHLISSQVDDYVVRPIDPIRFGVPMWRFTFLQHGVTKDDLSRWLNGKPISLFITATRQELESIAGDQTPYTFTTKETRLTGFPRHDRLLGLADALSAGNRRLVLVMPTWREELLGKPIRGGNSRQPLPGFWSTNYARQWLTVLESARLAEVAGKAGLRITFVPHPNMNVYLTDRQFPSHVQVYQYRHVDIQDLFARGALMVTDYSSNAFEMAYLERPVVYFQFDRDNFFSGRHVYRKGTWSYDDDGFGPVAFSASSVIEEIELLVSRGLQPDSVYAKRMREAFSFRDDKSSERVYRAIIDIKQPLTADEIRVAEETGFSASNQGS